MKKILTLTVLLSLGVASIPQKAEAIDPLTVTGIALLGGAYAWGLYKYKRATADADRAYWGRKLKWLTGGTAAAVSVVGAVALGKSYLLSDDTSIIETHDSNESFNTTLRLPDICGPFTAAARVVNKYHWPYASDAIIHMGSRKETSGFVDAYYECWEFDDGTQPDSRYPQILKNALKYAVKKSHYLLNRMRPTHPKLLYEQVYDSLQLSRNEEILKGFVSSN